ncbi:hypothetical protein ACOJBM_40460 [Rhizobium beringeri]|uniref:hypothetical protein n=1 Tax=Rhizobium beringeri TaxID=3019934 RepID=UPI003B5CADAC
MPVERLVPDGFYWARPIKGEGGKSTVVRVSAIFGEEPEFWTLMVPGSDQHHMPGDFEIIAQIERPAEYFMRHAAE